MSCKNPCIHHACGALRIIISIIFGAIIGILFAFGNIPYIVVSAWIVLALGVLTLIFLFIYAELASTNPQSALLKCLRIQINYLLAGTIGSIIAALVLLSIVPIFTSIIVDIIVAIAAFFFALMVIGWITLILCTLCRRGREE